MNGPRHLGFGAIQMPGETDARVRDVAAAFLEHHYGPPAAQSMREYPPLVVEDDEFVVGRGDTIDEPRIYRHRGCGGAVRFEGLAGRPGGFAPLWKAYCRRCGQRLPSHAVEFVADL